MKLRKRAHAPGFYRDAAFEWNDQAPQPNTFIFKARVDKMTFDCAGSLTPNMKGVYFTRVTLFTYGSMAGSEILKLPPLWQLGLIAMHAVSYYSSAMSFLLRIDEIDDFFPREAGDQIRARILAEELER